MLETLATRAWTTTEGPTISQRFLFTPAILQIRDDEPLGMALGQLYSHSRSWCPGFEVPFHVPGIRVTREMKEAGRFQIDSGGWLSIDVSPDFFGSPRAVWLILAHEACHHILNQSGLADHQNVARNERMTDLTMFVCGFGDLVLAGHTTAQRTDTGYLKTHLGYLSASEYRYCYDWVIAARLANQLGGVEGLMQPPLDVADGLRIAKPVTGLLTLLRSKIPEKAAQDRWINFFRSQNPHDTDEQIIRRVIDSLERDNR